MLKLSATFFGILVLSCPVEVNQVKRVVTTEQTSVAARRRPSTADPSAPSTVCMIIDAGAGFDESSATISHTDYDTSPPTVVSKTVDVKDGKICAVLEVPARADGLYDVTAVFHPSNRVHIVIPFNVHVEKK